MAAQILAAQIRSGIMGLFSGMFSNNFTRDPVSATPTLTQEQQVSRFTFGRANGGPVKGGSSYIVGERGPELFSPGVSGMITPNEMLGGSTNIVVNVDASGSNVQGDEEQGKELGRLISVAVQSEIIQQQRPGGLLA
jgi:phage-related minor tail protein